jgi:hypothetical protein
MKKVKKLKVIITNPEKTIYHGFLTDHMQLSLGKDVRINLSYTDPPQEYYINKIKGWVYSDTGQIIYIFDGDGKLSKIQRAK